MSTSIDLSATQTLRALNVAAAVGYAGSSAVAVAGIFNWWGVWRETVLTPGIEFFFLRTLIALFLLGFAGWQYRDSAEDTVTTIRHRFALLALASALSDQCFIYGGYQIAFVSALVAAFYSSLLYNLLCRREGSTRGFAVLIRTPFSALHAWSVISVPLSAFAIFGGGYPGVPGLVAAVVAMVGLMSLAVFYAFDTRQGDAVPCAVLTWYLVELVLYHRPVTTAVTAAVGTTVSALALAKSVGCSVYWARREGVIKLPDDDEEAGAGGEQPAAGPSA